MASYTPVVIAPPKQAFVVGVADMIASNLSNAELITYSLGSCLGVMLYDPVKRVGGLLHIMLPTSSIDPAKAASRPFMFVDTGVPRLFHAVYGLGGDKSRLLVKVAGGAQFMDEKKIFNIGQRNTQTLRELLAKNGVVANAMDVGGVTSRTVRMKLDTGDVSIQSPGQTTYLI